MSNAYRVKGREGFVIRWKNYEGRQVSRLVKVTTSARALDPGVVLRVAWLLESPRRFLPE